MVPTNWREAAESLLLDRGAATIRHPGGTLYAHVGRVADVLDAWGARVELLAAGLCHACYGTDGFATAILGLHERDRLAAIVGDEAEEIVYRYAVCDRAAVYPRLSGAGALVFTDRFTGRSAGVTDGAARDLVELTAANEIDLIRVCPEAAAGWAPEFHRLLEGAGRWLSAEALTAWEDGLPR